MLLYDGNDVTHRHVWFTFLLLKIGQYFSTYKVSYVKITLRVSGCDNLAEGVGAWTRIQLRGEREQLFKEAYQVCYGAGGGACSRPL